VEQSSLGSAARGAVAEEETEEVQFDSHLQSQASSEICRTFQVLTVGLHFAGKQEHGATLAYLPYEGLPLLYGL